MNDKLISKFADQLKTTDWSPVRTEIKMSARRKTNTADGVIYRPIPIEYLILSIISIIIIQSV